MSNELNYISVPRSTVREFAAVAPSARASFLYMQGTSKRGILCFKPALRLEEQGNQRYQRTIVADVTEGFDTHRSGRPLAGWMSSSRRVFGVLCWFAFRGENLTLRHGNFGEGPFFSFPSFWPGRRP